MDLHAAFLALVRERETILNEASTWTSEALCYRGAKDSWCALELIDHLSRAEKLTTVRIHETLRGNFPHRREGRLRRALLFSILQSSLRVSVPKQLPELIPQIPSTLQIVADDWRRAHSDLILTSKQVDLQDHRLAVFRHPVGGRMSLTSAITFLTLHLRHHRHQWNRLRIAAT